MHVMAVRTLGILLAAVGGVAVSAAPAGAFPDGQRVLVRTALDDRCVKAEMSPRTADAPPLQLVLTECDTDDPAQRFSFNWSTLSTDSAPGLCVAPAGRQLALTPCDESDRSQRWVSRPLGADDVTDHVEAEGRGVSWTAAADGTVSLEPTRDRAEQEWLYTPVAES